MCLVFKIVSLKVFFEQGRLNQSFPIEFWMKGIVRDYEKSFFENFSVLEKVTLKSFPFWNLTFKAKLPGFGRLTFEFESLKNVKFAYF